MTMPRDDSSTIFDRMASYESRAESLGQEIDELTARSNRLRETAQHLRIRREQVDPPLRALPRED